MQAWVLGCFLLAITGCMSRYGIMREYPQKIEEAQQEKSEAIKQTQDRFPQPGLVRVKRPLVSGKEIKDINAELPPEIFDQTVTYRTASAQSLAEISAQLAKMAKINVDIREIVTADASSPMGGAPMPGPGMSGSGNSIGDLPSPIILPGIGMGGGGSGLGDVRLAITFSGKFKELLDRVALESSSSWRFDRESNRIIFYRYDYRILALKVPNLRSQGSSSISIGGTGGTGGASTSGSVSLSSNQNIDQWQSIMQTIQIFLGRSQQGGMPTGDAGGAGGGTGASQLTVSGADGFAVANRDLGQLVVVARPSAMAKILDYVEQVNRRFARNVLIDVRILEVQYKDDAGAGINIGALINKVASAGSFLNDVQIEISGASILSPGAGPTTVTFTGNKDWGNSNMQIDSVVQALAGVSAVSLRNQAQIVAINGQPAPFQQANNVRFVSGITTTQTPNVGAQTSVQTEDLTVGFTANFLPLVLEDNRILLQYQLQTSSLLGMKTVQAGNSQIQLPEVFAQSLQQQAYLNDGDIIALFGFERERSQTDERNGLLSVSRTAAGDRAMTVVLIQARVAKG